MLLYSFEFFDHARQRWVRGRYRAAREVIAMRYARWRIVGEPELRGDSGPGTASHLQSSPTPSGNVPTDLADAAALVRSVYEPEWMQEERLAFEQARRRSPPEWGEILEI